MADLVVVAAGAESAAVNADRLEDLREDAARDLGDGSLHAAEAVRETWRALEEFNLNARSPSKPSSSDFSGSCAASSAWS